MATRNLGEVLVGAGVLAVAAAFLVYALSHSGRSSAGGYGLTASFDHIDGLGVGADVRIAGVKVGSVTSAAIDPKSFNAVVTLTVQDGLEVPKDSSAEVTSDGLLGGKYLSISPGGDTTDLKPGQRIEITQGSVSLEQLLGKFIFSVTNMNNAGKKPDAKADPTG
jgi:phospholipid/cholesterol/gamma-HCH transport system substrate-binding protein